MQCASPHLGEGPPFEVCAVEREVLLHTRHDDDGVRRDNAQEQAPNEPGNKACRLHCMSHDRSVPDGLTLKA